MSENKIGMVTAIIELIAAMLSLVSLFNGEKIFVVIISVVNIILIIFLACTLIYRKNKSSIIKKEVRILNREIDVCFKNLYYDLKYSYKNDDSVNAINTIAMAGLRQYVDCIAKLFRIYTSENITVTIRFFDKRIKDSNESVLKVLSYSSNCSEERKDSFSKESEDNHKEVNKNTDFKVFVGDRKVQINYFYAPDLCKIHELLKLVGEQRIQQYDTVLGKVLQE